MLSEIKCDELKIGEKNTIRFHTGLNIISSASTPDGTLLLKMVDFCFGGNSYVNECVNDRIDSHDVEFVFSFNDGVEYRCIRNTLYPEIVRVLENGQFINKRIGDFKNWLMRKYGISYPNGDLWAFINQFFRFSYNEILKSQDKININTEGESVIVFLEKLFGLYDDLFEARRRLDKESKRLDIYIKAKQEGIISNIDYSDEKNNEIEKLISETKNKIEVLSKEMYHNIVIEEMRIDNLVSKEKIKMRNVKKKYESLLMKYHLINKNRNAREAVTVDDINKLIEFFPNTNTKRIHEVNAFHHKLSLILEKEMDNELENLQELIQAVVDEIFRQEHIISNSRKMEKAIIPSMENCIKLSEELYGLKKKSEICKKIIGINNKLSLLEKELKGKEKSTFDVITMKLNGGISYYSSFIKEYRPPIVEIESSSKYSVAHIDERNAILNTIIIDMGILENTALPVVVYDDSILKFIDKSVKNELLVMFTRVRKQIFLALDNNEYDAEILRTLKPYIALNIEKE